MQEIATRLITALDQDPSLRALLKEHLQAKGLDLAQALERLRVDELQDLFARSLQDVRISTEDRHRQIMVEYDALQWKIRCGSALVAVAAVTALAMTMANGPRALWMAAMIVLMASALWVRKWIHRRASLVESRERGEITVSGYTEATRRLATVHQRLQQRPESISREAYLEELFTALCPTSPEALPALEQWNTPQHQDV